MRTPRTRPTARIFLLLAAALTILAWQFPPYGDALTYPFTLLATYAHELGHGLTALALGGRFESFVLYLDGSGLAAWSGDVGRVGRALVAAGGLVGPSLAGGAILALSRRPARSRWVLYALAGVLVATGAAFARNALALAFCFGGGAALAAAGRALPLPAATFLVQLIGVQLCVAIFHHVPYMLSAGGLVDGRLHGSDSAAMAEALLLPYWVWGGLCAAVSVLFLGLGLRHALRGEGSPPRSGRAAGRRAASGGA